MSRTYRTTIGRLMGVVLAAAVGFAALRHASESWAGAMLLLTCGAILLAVVATACRGPGDRAHWLGFVLFGAGYLALAHWTATSRNPLPTVTLAEAIGSWIGSTFSTSNRMGEGWDSLSPMVRIWHCAWALALGLLGSIIAGFAIGRIAAPATDSPGAPGSPGPPSWPRWTGPALIGLAVFWIAAMAAAIGRWPRPGIWAGAGFLVSCGVLGLAGLGALFGEARARAACLGAALFGFGYLTLSFGQSQVFIVAPHLPTEALLNRLIRPDNRPIQSEFPDFNTAGFSRIKNEILMRKLDRPIPFSFANATPLEDVLKYVRTATHDASFPDIPIYVDPIGLQEAGRSLNSTVSIDVNLPVRDGLRLCLKQLGLAFCVRDGFVMITDEDHAAIPISDDPVQVAGHSLIALVAAGLGAGAAILVSGRTVRSLTPDGRAD